MTLKVYGEYHNICSFMQALKTPQYFSNPAMDTTFTNIIDNDMWKSDDSFVQRRLAGVCPFNIRKVTQNGKVYYLLHEYVKNI